MLQGCYKEVTFIILLEYSVLEVSYGKNASQVNLAVQLMSLLSVKTSAAIG